jgi:glycyl-tRNA synthetase
MSEPKENVLMEKIVSLCKRRGFIYQSSEIYGGINGFWDYGPLGAELKRNVKEQWWKTIVHQRDDVAGLEATIIMHPKIWEASGHVATFTDPMCDCLLTKKRFRADQIEPQSGIVYHYSGAVALHTFTAILGQLKELSAEQHAAITAIAPSSALEFWAELGAPKYRESGDSLVQAAFEWISKEIDGYAGVRSSDERFSVLLQPGKPPESARKIAVQFYEQRGVSAPTLLGETTEKIDNSQRYNPENGSLLTEPKPFNLMFKTYVGPTATEADVAYLRPETAQAIFAQFKNVHETARQKVPFGIGQMGKAFRNEVTPRNFTFRSREFEQMELEFFIKPDEAVEALAGSVAKAADNAWQGEPQADWGWEVWHKYWVEQRIRFYEGIGLTRDCFEEYWQKPEELAHYARACVDILYKFPFGTQELEGIAARGDFDLSQHEKHSGKPMGVFDEELRAAWGRLDEAKKAAMQAKFIADKTAACLKKGTPEAEAKTQAEAEAKVYFDKLAKGQYIPHVIEPSAGVDRLILALLANAYSEITTTDEKGKSETRVVMKFHPRIAPVKVGIFPLLKNKPELVAKAKEVRDLLCPHMTVFYDDGGAIGRRYARQDEAGTPFGLTIDFDTLGEKPELLDTVTLRDRDTQQQTRVAIKDLLGLLLPKVR